MPTNYIELFNYFVPRCECDTGDWFGPNEGNSPMPGDTLERLAETGATSDRYKFRFRSETGGVYLIHHELMFTILNRQTYPMARGVFLATLARVDGGKTAYNINQYDLNYYAAFSLVSDGTLRMLTTEIVHVPPGKEVLISQAGAIGSFVAPPDFGPDGWVTPVFLNGITLNISRLNS